MSDDGFSLDIHRPLLLLGHFSSFKHIQILIKSQYFTYKNHYRFYLSKFLRCNMIIIITWNILIIGLIFIVIVARLRPICPSASFRCFMSNSGVFTESRTEFFLWTTGVDSSKSVNHDQIQLLCYVNYSLLVLPVVRIEPATSRWFPSEAPSIKTPYPLHHVSLQNNAEWIFGTYKPNVAITFFFTQAHIGIILNQAFFINGS